jgi:hypothetical protein
MGEGEYATGARDEPNAVARWSHAGPVDGLVQLVTRFRFTTSTNPL